MSDEASTSSPLLRFDKNTNPYGCSPAVNAALGAVAALESDVLAWYHDEYATPVREAYAARLGLHPDNVCVTNGSGSALVQIGISYLLRTGRAMVTTEPTYRRYGEIAAVCESPVVAVPLDADGRLAPDELVDALRGCPEAVVMLATPNNPTAGLLCGLPEMERVVGMFPEALFVIDEAYAEFSGVTYSPLVLRHENAVVIRTMSKAYGLASLRVGVLLATPERAAFHRMVTLPWSVNRPAQAAALAALGDDGHLASVVDRTIRAREEFVRRLRGLGIPVLPSDANFLFLPLGPVLAERCRREAERAGMVVRAIAGGLRVTVLDTASNSKLVDCLSAVVLDAAPGAGSLVGVLE